MCGIFGLLVSDHSGIDAELYQSTMERLFLLSESRGKEAAGVAVLAGDSIRVYKEPSRASAMVRSRRYRELLDDVLAADGQGPCAILAHSRLVASGPQTVNENNRPVVASGLVDVSAHDERARQALRRCTRCILPQTVAFIDFDDDGVCNYCHGYRKMEPRGPDTLEAVVARHRRTDGQPDCILAFSGGRETGDRTYCNASLRNKLKLTAYYAARLLLQRDVERPTRRLSAPSPRRPFGQSARSESRLQAVFGCEPRP